MRKFLLGLCLLFAMTACGGGSAGLITAGVERQVPPPGISTDAVVAGLNAFAHQLYGKAAKPGTNVVFSPFSIGCAFAMARAGARAGTGAKLDGIFGFPESGPHTVMNSLLGQTVSADGDRPVLTVANGLFAQQDLPIGADFLRVMGEQYGSGVHTVDFGKPSQAKAAIDKWAAEHTHGRIEKVFDSLDPGTRLVLANALYFKARWHSPFMPPAKAPFTRADGKVVQVDMIGGSGSGFREGPDGSAAEIPYQFEQFAMWVMLPKAGADPATMLTPQRLAELKRAAPHPGGVSVKMPKWEFETGIDLLEAVPALGGGDYSGISAGLTVGQAQHRANITVDEAGTQAAAVTGVGMRVSGQLPPATSITLDRPFAFAIVHRETGLPLFVGTVADPAAR